MLAAFSSPEYSRQLSLQERERLYNDARVHFTAFSPRPESSLAVRKSTPLTTKQIEVRHRVRTPAVESTIIYPLATYQTWIDAGDIEPLPLEKPDPEYNSNVWRNFSRENGFTCNVSGKATPSLIAAIYPISIPPPSRMRDFTYGRFIKYGDVMKSNEAKKKKIVETERQLDEMKRLEIMTAGRIPPTDMNGRIIAPLELRRLQAQGRIKHRPLPTDSNPKLEERRTGLLFDPQSAHGSGASRTSTALRHKGLLWKFSYKMNTPAYNRRVVEDTNDVMNEQMDLQRWRENNARMRRLRRENMAHQIVSHYG